MKTRGGFLIREGVQRRSLSAWVAVVLLAIAVPVQGQGFELLDGDTVVLLGDSNTAPGTYSRYLERFTAIRYPERSIRYINMGIGGDTAEGGLARLQRDVFDRGATVLIVTYGINDICWGFCDDAEHRDTFYQSIIGILVECINRGVRVYVTTYPYRGVESVALQEMTTTATTIAAYLGEGSIDLYTAMQELDPDPAATQACYAASGTCPSEFESACRQSCNKWAPTDSVHLSDIGQRAWAYALAKDLGAPPEVSSATLDAPSGSVVAQSGTTISNLSWDPGAGRLSFDRLDAGQPLTFASNTQTYFQNNHVPFQTLGRVILRVTNLPAGSYRVSIGGQQLGELTSGALSNGVNLSSLADGPYEYGGPWMFQNQVLEGLTAARSSANRLLFNADPGALIEGLLTGFDSVLGLIQAWVAAPAANTIVVEAI